MAEDPPNSSGDDRVDAGLIDQADLRRRLVGAHNPQVGWKVGFGSPSGLAAMELAAPIIGFLTDEGEFLDGATIDVSAWTSPVIECEVAAIVSRDIPAGTTADQIDDHIAAWAPAFEFADIDEPPRDVRRVLAGNIFHRGYRLGERFTASASSVMELTAQVSVDGESTEVVDLPALTGDLRAVIARAAQLAPITGRGVSAGDVILTGSVVPPVPVRPGSVVTYRLQGSPTMAASFA